MNALVFGLLAFFFSSLALYFVARFYVRVQLPSLVCAALGLGWLVAVAREMKWLPRLAMDHVLAMAFVVGMCCWLLVFVYESQQPTTIVGLVLWKLRAKKVRE